MNEIQITCIDLAKGMCVLYSAYNAKGILRFVLRFRDKQWQLRQPSIRKIDYERTYVDISAQEASHILRATREAIASGGGLV